jgi:cytoskeletal protein CcmA (bactofilin family)
MKTTTVIGPDTHIKGEMHFDSTARILGTFEGRVTAKGEIQVGEGAVCKAAVEATTIIVDGQVEGDVVARERVTLNSKARVIGDVVSTTLVVAEGASFTGHVRVGADAHAAGTEKRTGTTTTTGRPTGSTANVSTPKPAELEATLAGLEARLSGMGRNRVEATNGADH